MMGTIIDEKMLTINRQREAILRFYSAMTTQDYEWVVQEYLGKTDDINWTNKLYANVEATIHFMNTAPITKSIETIRGERR